MTPEQIKKGGWIEHDGKGMPDCYGPDDRVAIYSPGKGLFTILADDIRWKCEHNEWPHNQYYHRRHYSTDELLVMARDALARMTPEEPIENDWWCPSCASAVIATSTEHCDSCGTYLSNCQPSTENVNSAHKTLTLINERLGDD